MDNDNYKQLFFVKENLRGYVRNYKQYVDILTTKRRLWKYILNTAWKKDEIIFINKEINEKFYALNMRYIYNKVLKVNPYFSIDIYIIFNIDLLNTHRSTYDYFNHYLDCGKNEDRICCIESSKSCNIDILTNNYITLKKTGNCLYDFIHYFIHNRKLDIKCNKVVYDNTFTTENSHKSAVNLIQAMKELLIDKTTTTINSNYNPTDISNIVMLKKLELTYIKVVNTVNLSAHNDNSIIVSKFKFYDNTQIYSKFPFIYHKYNLNLVKRDEIINYNLIHSINEICNKSCKIVAHLHCLDIERFDTFYGSFIKIIQKHMPIIIITYSFGTPIMKYSNCIMLKIKNKGMDIGGKIIAVDYLNRLQIKYEYILFLHSKSDPIKRAEYFNPFFNNLPFILKSIEQNEYDGYFPPLILNGDYYHLIHNDQFTRTTNFSSERDVRNSRMFNEFCDLLELDKTLLMFPEGNNFILSYDTAIELYKPEFYNLLNEQNSFDAHWVMIYYRLYKLNIAEIYNEYKMRKLYGNNIETTLGHNGLADSQIEHVFERLVFNIIQKNKGKICILPFSQTVSNKTLYLENNINNSYMYGAMKITDKDLILSNNINMENTSTITIIACHTNTNLKIQCLMHNIGIFIKISTKIVICNSYEFKHQNIESMVISTYPDSINMIDFKYIQNDRFVCHSKWNHVINHYYSTLFNYHHFILTNDSYLYIKDTDELSNFIDVNYEMQTILISNEGHNHYTDFLRVYNFSGIIKINNFYKWFIAENKNKPVTFQDIINGLEMKSHIIFDKKNGLYEENNPVNIHFTEPYKQKFIEELHYPIIKIKTMLTTIYDTNIVPSDFQPFVYTSLHNDLHHLTNSEIIKNHFKTSGMKEGRVYKRGQIAKLSPYIEKYLNKFNITL
mgnify:CR=1 FL=1|jgi:hypothetical protein